MARPGRPKGSKNKRSRDKRPVIGVSLAQFIRLQRTLKSLSRRHGKDNIAKILKEL